MWAPVHAGATRPQKHGIRQTMYNLFIRAGPRWPGEGNPLGMATGGVSTRDYRIRRPAWQT
jgi:hypothetical protein